MKCSSKLDGFVLLIDLALTRRSARQMQLALILLGSVPQRQEGIQLVWRKKRKDKLDFGLVGLNMPTPQKCKH